MTAANITSRFLESLRSRIRKRTSRLTHKKRRSLLMELLEGRALMATFAQGDIALLGVNSANPDTIRFTNLKAMDAGDVINFTDNGFTAGATGRTGEGFLTFTAPAGGVAAGTISTWNNGMNITGTPWSSNNPTNFALNGSGDQLFVFSGNTANWATQSGITLLYGINFGVALSATSSASNTVQPTALTTGFLNLPATTNANSYYSGTGSAATTVPITGTTSAIFTDLLTPAKWFGNGAAAATFPTHSITINSGTNPTVSVSATSATANEGNAGNTGFTFTVTRSSGTGTGSVNWAVTGSGANAANAADFGGTLPSGTVNFADTEISKVVTVNVSGDTLVESDEGFTISLSSPVSLDLGSPSSATGTIQNDDSSFSIVALSATKAEGNSGTTPFTFTVTRTGNLTTAATVDYATIGSGTNPTDSSDFSGATGNTINFAINQATATITLNVVGDTSAEQDETFTVTLSNAAGSGVVSAILGTPVSATGTIQNDDAATILSIAATDASKAEGNTGTTPFTFTVTRSGDTTGASSATWTISGTGGTAADISSALTGPVSFAANETSQVITVDVIGDTVIESDDPFTITLSAPSSGVAISTAIANGLIVNDDRSVALPATPITTVEGNSGSTVVNVTVTRTGDTSVATNVDWAVTGSGTNPASASDFAGAVLPSGTIAFAIGETTQTISFSVQGDTLLEQDETYTVTLGTTSNGTIGTPATLAGTISNDDFGSLVAGDIVITGINTTNPDQFAFVPLVDLPAGQIITFTDNAFSGTALATNEGVLTYTAPAGGLLAGTKVVIQATGGAASILNGAAGTAFTSGTGFALNGSGDNLFAYTGTAASPNFLFGLTTGSSYLTTGATTASTTYLPSTLLVGTSAVAPLATTGTIANAQFNVTQTNFASASAARTAVATQGNWTNSSSVLTLGTSNFTFSATPSVVITSGNTVYSGSSYIATASVTGFNSPDPSASLSFSYYASQSDADNLVNSLAASPVNVGLYWVRASTTANSGNTAGLSSSTQFQITQKAATITADAKSKTYGGSDPALTFVATGLVGPDTQGSTATGALTRVSGENVGTYAIQQGNVSLGANYSLTYVGANLSVTQASATVTADVQSKTYGSADPALTFVATGLVNGDTQGTTATGALTRVAGENVGTYAIQQGNVSLSANYNVTYVGADLTVTQAAATVTADAQSKTYGGSDPALTFVATGLVNGDTQGSTATGVLTRVEGETVGTYAIQQGTVSLGGNYSVTYVGANLTINPAAVAPTFVGASVNGADTFLNSLQRSQITSLVLNFSAPVIIANNAFSIANIGLITAQSPAALASSQILVSGSGTQVITLRWANGNATGSNGVVSRVGTGALGNSLADGNWQLTIDSSKVTSVAGGSALTGNNQFGATAADDFFRLFGDSNGDGLVSPTDSSAFKAAYSSGSLTFNNAALDWNGDGLVQNSGGDRSNFLGNYNKRRRANFGLPS